MFSRRFLAGMALGLRLCASLESTTTSSSPRVRAVLSMRTWAWWMRLKHPAANTTRLPSVNAGLGLDVLFLLGGGLGRLFLEAFLQALLEAVDGPSALARELRDLVRSEQDQADHHDDEDLAVTEITHWGAPAPLAARRHFSIFC